jgi:hypothetical protein
MKDNYIVIQGWMVTELKLSGNNLLAYALIYGFSQDGNSEFTGSINYVCNWLNCSRPTAIKALKELCELKLIFKSENNINGVVFNRYKISLEGVKKLNGGSKETLHGGSKETLPNNTIINNTNNNIVNKIIPKTELQLAFDSYLEMRKKIKKPATGKAIELVKNKLKTLANGSELVAIEILNQSTLNSWVDVYPLKNDNSKKEKPTMRTTNEVFDKAKEFILNGGVINQ